MLDFKITFLGTCAYDFSPKLMNKFKDTFDLDARRASSALINGKFLIDCGPHCCNSLDIIGKDYSEITDVFFTHFHCDHCDINGLSAIACDRKRPLRVWLRSDAKLPEVDNIYFIRMNCGVEYQIDSQTTVVGLKANHDQSAFPQWLLFNRNSTKFLYALDGAWYINETFNYLKNSHLSLVVMDATVGNRIGDFRMAEHNSIPMIRMMIPSLKTVGIVDEKTKIYLSHIAPSLHNSHTETDRLAKKFGARAAYDGLTVEV